MTNKSLISELQRRIKNCETKIRAYNAFPNPDSQTIRIMVLAGHISVYEQVIKILERE